MAENSRAGANGHRLEDALAHAQNFLTPEEKTEFEAHLATCAECQQSVAFVRTFLPALHTAVSSLPRLTDAELLATVKARVEARTRKVRFPRWLIPLVLVPAALAVAVLLYSSRPSEPGVLASPERPPEPRAPMVELLVTPEGIGGLQKGVAVSASVLQQLFPFAEPPTEVDGGFDLFVRGRGRTLVLPGSGEPYLSVRVQKNGAIEATAYHQSVVGPSGLHIGTPWREAQKRFPDMRCTVGPRAYDAVADCTLPSVPHVRVQAIVGLRPGFPDGGPLDWAALSPEIVDQLRIDSFVWTAD